MHYLFVEQMATLDSKVRSYALINLMATQLYFHSHSVRLIPIPFSDDVQKTTRAALSAQQVLRDRRENQFTQKYSMCLPISSFELLLALMPKYSELAIAFSTNSIKVRHLFYC